MDAIVALAVPLVIVGFLRWLSMQWFPWVMRPLERLMHGVMRMFWNLTWRQSMRQWGVLNTMWLWLVVLAALASVGALQNERAVTETLIPVWMLVVSGWLGLRALARWRFRPRALPTRRRWRGL